VDARRRDQAEEAVQSKRKGIDRAPAAGWKIHLPFFFIWDLGFGLRERESRFQEYLREHQRGERRRLRGKGKDGKVAIAKAARRNPARLFREFSPLRTSAVPSFASARACGCGRGGVVSAPAGPRSAVACLTTCDVKRMGWAWADAVTPVDASFTHSCTASISQKKKKLHSKLREICYKKCYTKWLHSSKSSGDSRAYLVAE
jgi:hypothetical protein